MKEEEKFGEAAKPSDMYLVSSCVVLVSSRSMLSKRVPCAAVSGYIDLQDFRIEPFESRVGPSFNVFHRA